MIVDTDQSVDEFNELARLMGGGGKQDNSKMPSAIDLFPQPLQS